jgi:hypothetical protein
MKRKVNPILAAIELSLKSQRRTAIMDGWHKESKETQLDIIRWFFTRETIEEAGCLVLGAVLAGDKRMIAQVRDAIKAGDHLFNRDRELVLLRPALWYRLTHWDSLMLTHKGDVHRSLDELKKGIEAECNHGKQLGPHQWSRLRRVMGLPKRSTVRHDRNREKKFGEIGEIIDLAPPPTKKRRRRTSGTKRH